MPIEGASDNREVKEGKTQRNILNTSGRVEGKDGTCIHPRTAKTSRLHIGQSLHQNVKGQGR